MRMGKCSCCKRDLTSKTINRVKRFKDHDAGVDSIYFNCAKCNSTMVIVSEETRKKFDLVKKAA